MLECQLFELEQMGSESRFLTAGPAARAQMAEWSPSGPAALLGRAQTAGLWKSPQVGQADKVPMAVLRHSGQVQRLGKAVMVELLKYHLDIASVRGRMDV